jgi:hypothetical protein
MKRSQDFTSNSNNYLDVTPIYRVRQLIIPLISSCQLLPDDFLSKLYILALL